jgi:O-antigen/teichoic acid export membrane protein
MTAVSNARWVALGQVVRVALQLIGVAILSRILAPRDFGLVAMALVVANFANLVRDLGTGSAVIQRDDLDEETKQTAYWFSVGLGVVLGIGIASLAPLLSMAFKAPDLTGILVILSLTFPMASLGSVHQALLERNSRFNVVARIETVSGVLGLGVGLILAQLGAGAYSLVGQLLTAATVSSFQLSRASGWRPRWAWNADSLRAIWKFSGRLAAFNLVNYFSRNADSMIIGRFLGPGVLGAYSLAYRLMLFPVQNLTSVASRALFPVMSRHQNPGTETANLYLRTLSVIATITAPMMAGLFALRDIFVPAVLGSQWSAVIDIISWLAPTGFVQSLVSTVGTVFMARGRTDILFRLGVVGAVVQISSFLIGIRWGAVGVAQCYFVANLVNAWPCLGTALRLVERTMVDMLARVWRPMAAAAVMAALLLAMKNQLIFQTIPGVPRLIALSVIGALIYTSLIAVFARTATKDVLRLVLKRA